MVAFEAPKPLKLIDLGDDDTLGYVWAGLESDIRWTEAQLARLQGENPPTTNPEAIVVVSQQLAELRQEMEIVQLTTGYNTSYTTQLELLLQYGDAITGQGLHQFCLRLCYALDGAQPFQMYGAHVGHDADLWACYIAQEGDLAQRIHAHLEHCSLVFRLKGNQGEGETYLIVVVAGALQSRARL